MIDIRKVKIFGGVFMSLPIIIDTDPGIDDASNRSCIISYKI